MHDRIYIYVDEFIQTIKLDGTPGVNRVIVKLSRIMVWIKLENSVFENSKPVIKLYRKIPKNHLICGISGIAWVIITFSKIMLLRKIQLC